MGINRITEQEWDRMNASYLERLKPFREDNKDVIKELADLHSVSDGSTASYYELPKNTTELQELISAKNMNAQIGEIFRECYRYGQASHSNELRGIKKILFYATAELKRLENLCIPSKS